MSYTIYPDTPPDPSEDPRYKVIDEIWWVTGINFQFAFIDRDAAEAYCESANSSYHLGCCTITQGKRIVHATGTGPLSRDSRDCREAAEDAAGKGR